MRQYEISELVFQGPEPENDWVNVDLEGTFKTGQEVIIVRGFYAGNGVYKIRFTPKCAGTCRFEVRTSIPLTGFMSGDSEVQPALPNQHGSVCAVETHFEYQDGSRYLPFGTTVYALIHQEQSLIDETMETLAEAPFNKIRFCVFPKHFDFNRNEPELFAFEKDEHGKWDVRKPCMEFWNRLDTHLSELGSLGIQADLILLHPYDHWGFMSLTKQEYLTYFEYMIRRISAYPNLWWSLANEYDLLDSLEDSDWSDLIRYLSEEDPYHHLISIHNFVRAWDFSDSNVTHVCLQTSDAAKIPLLLEKYGKPVVFDEMGYEGNIPYNWGNLSAFEEMNRFWKVCTLGGYATHGETYMQKMNHDQVLWWSKGGKLKGESPRRIAFLKNLLEEFPEPFTLYHENSMPFHTQEELRELVAGGVKGISDNQVLKCMCKMTDPEFQHMMEFFTQPIIHIGNQAFLTYLGDACTIFTTLNLPTDGTFRIEVIDAWEMTRKTVQTGVSGAVNIDLPGKAGMAVLAVRE